MTPTRLLVPTYMQMLRTLAGLLDKARIAQDAPDRLMSARLAPDMLPLASQVRFSVFQAQEATFRLRGEVIPEWLNRVAAEGRNADTHPGSMAEARTRIDDAIAFLERLSGDALDTGVARSITLDLPNGLTFDMTGEQYVRDWALPQFYFHVITAYAILRNHGVEIGKADYVPHMFAYIRHAPVP